MERAATVSEDPIHEKMAELRLACQREIRIRRQRSELASISFRDFLGSINSKVEENVLNREKLIKLKDYLRKLEIDLDHAISVKICKEATLTAISKSVSSAAARTEQLDKKVQDQRAWKDEYAALTSQQLPLSGTIEEQSSEDLTDTKNIEEAIVSYKMVLGFRTEVGEGIKFIFNNINLKSADREYIFTVRFDGDIYKLMNCDPYMEDIKGLIKDLNKSNDLFKFVRIVREKFQVAALNRKNLPYLFWLIFCETIDFVLL